MGKTYSVGLVGESNYQDAIAGLREGERVFLVHEPDNPHDPRAIAARDSNGAPIGYVARDSWLADALIDQGKGSIATVERIEGGDAGRPSRGVVLTVEIGEKGAAGGGYSGPTSASGTSQGGVGKKIGSGCGVILAAIVLLGFIGAAFAPKADDAAAIDSADQVMMPSDDALADAALEETESAEDLLTPSQANALRSARDYIAMSGFSREGLIQQLSSEYGNGYSRDDATAAVDSMDVNWDEQAARSARDYLDMSGFSCSGLIKQLSSDYGNKYTRSQAEFGAREAGAC